MLFVLVLNVAIYLLALNSPLSFFSFFGVLKLFFGGLKNCLIAKFAPEGFYRLVYMLRCSKADFEEVDFFVWKP